jgi:CheY-like chemotaxis protein
MLWQGQNITRAPTAAAHENQRDRQSSSRIGSAPPRNMPTMQLVDDVEAEIAISRMILERARYAAIAAGDGDAALELLDDGVAPEVVVSDLEMPRVDGLQVLRAPRNAEPTHDRPRSSPTAPTERADERPPRMPARTPGSTRSPIPPRRCRRSNTCSTTADPTGRSARLPAPAKGA